MLKEIQKKYGFSLSEFFQSFLIASISPVPLDDDQIVRLCFPFSLFLLLHFITLRLKYTTTKAYKQTFSLFLLLPLSLLISLVHLCKLVVNFQSFLIASIYQIFQYSQSLNPSFQSFLIASRKKLIWRIPPLGDIITIFQSFLIASVISHRLLLLLLSHDSFQVFQSFLIASQMQSDMQQIIVIETRNTNFQSFLIASFDSPSTFNTYSSKA